MAIYHFSAKVISRAAGSSAVASAAYRSASRLPDQRLGRDHDFSNKPGVGHSEVMLPDGAPEHLSDRSMLWNAVETGEVRKDAQLAREVEFAIPREITQEQGVALARDFVQREFVDQGMVADLNVHWDRGTDGLMKPHAHVMLTMREVTADGFGAKVRDWNRTELLQAWRERWADHVNERLAALGIEARVDHRSFEARGIELEPQHKIGAAAGRMVDEGLESDRLGDHTRIARENGEKLLAKPSVALAMITREQATFTERDLARFVHRHSDGKDQFDQIMSAVRASPELAPLGRDGRGELRFTSQAMIRVEQRLDQAAEDLAGARDHGVGPQQRTAALETAAERGLVLSGEQRDAFRHVTGKEGLAAVVGYAGSGKSAMLGVAREAWEGAGYTVRGAALSGIAAENLEGGSGIASRTLASLEHGWEQGRDLPTLVRYRAIQRHARAVAAIFQMQDEGHDYTPDQMRSLHAARAELDRTDPHASRDMERAYKVEPALAHEAAAGDLRRAVKAMRLEEELRVTAPARAEAFVERWRQLDTRRLAAYQAGDFGGERSFRNSMGEMAKSLERDPQLESILTIKKSAQLGIEGLAHERNLTCQLAISIGLDLGRGRGLGP